MPYWKERQPLPLYNTRTKCLANSRKHLRIQDVFQLMLSKHFPMLSLRVMYAQSSRKHRRGIVFLKIVYRSFPEKQCSLIWDLSASWWSHLSCEVGIGLRSLLHTAEEILTSVECTDCLLMWIFKFLLKEYQILNILHNLNKVGDLSFSLHVHHYKLESKCSTKMNLTLKKSTFIKSWSLMFYIYCKWESVY